MGMLMIAIGIGYFVGFAIFLWMEELSLRDADFSDMKDVFTEELKLNECSKKFDTVRYMLIFVVLTALLAFLVGSYIIPHPLAWYSIISYILIPAWIGSLIILLVKWRFQPFIKFVSSFLFGAGYMLGSGLGLGIVYLLSSNVP